MQNGLPSEPAERTPSERTLASRRVYEGRILNLRVDDVELAGGGRAVREVVEHRKAVGVLALTGRGSVFLVRQFRYAVGEETLEICAGLVEEGEDLKEAAAREMREELGHSPGVLREIGTLYASPGFCTESLTLFLAADLSVSRLPQDDDENVQTSEVPYDGIPALLSGGAVKDAKTFAALSWFLACKSGAGGMAENIVF
ncbi:MAG: NUDIX hydrolase [Synergistaceae bacterium]|jgi:ADP-ribose pyrophosphatase|nr:NUDIX hydrolase [Synergistaceae bacterium]